MRPHLDDLSGTRQANRVHQALFRRWLASWQEAGSAWNWPMFFVVAALMLMSLMIGLGLGRYGALRSHSLESSKQETTGK